MSWFENALSLLSPGWVGSLIGLAGVISAVVVYLLTRQRTRLGFSYFGEHLLGSSSDSLPQGITVQYAGITIPRLTRSVIVLWNCGENTLLGDSIVKKDQLRFCVREGGRILSIQVVKASRDVNEFVFSPPPPNPENEAIFTFNYLDKNDGVVVEILHTSADKRPSIKGTLRGLPNGLREFGQMSRRPQKRTLLARFNSVISTWVPITLGGLMGLLAVFAPVESFFVFGSTESSSILFALSAAYMGLGALSLFSSRRKYPKALHVEALE
jgi:hypothetical protein